jgi:hypothetical protein
VQPSEPLVQGEVQGQDSLYLRPMRQDVPKVRIPRHITYRAVTVHTQFVIAASEPQSPWFLRHCERKVSTWQYALPVIAASEPQSR